MCSTDLSWVSCLYFILKISIICHMVYQCITGGKKELQTGFLLSGKYWQISRINGLKEGRGNGDTEPSNTSISVSLSIIHTHTHTYTCPLVSVIQAVTSYTRLHTKPFTFFAMASASSLFSVALSYAFPTSATKSFTVPHRNLTASWIVYKRKEKGGVEG